MACCPTSELDPRIHTGSAEMRNGTGSRCGSVNTSGLKQRIQFFARPRVGHLSSRGRRRRRDKGRDEELAGSGPCTGTSPRGEDPKRAHSRRAQPLVHDGRRRRLRVASVGQHCQCAAFTAVVESCCASPTSNPTASMPVCATICTQSRRHTLRRSPIARQSSSALTQRYLHAAHLARPSSLDCRRTRMACMVSTNIQATSSRIAT